MDKLLFGIDVGTTSVKAALFTPNGALQAVGQSEYPVQYIRPGWVEQNPDDWWKATCIAVRQALNSVPDGALRVAGIAVSSQAPTMLALDANHRPVRPALIWMDRRAEAEAAQFDTLLGEAGMTYRITGNRPDAFYVASKILWFKNHEPHLHKQTARFVSIPSYISHLLTGMFTLDPVHAALLQLRVYSTGEWSAPLCEICGVEPSQFPEVFPGHHIQGEITAAAAEATGLRAGTPVMVGSVDGSVAAVEAGAVDIGSAAEMTGTSTVLLMPNDGVSEPAFIAMPHAIPDVHLLLGAMVASGASLRWFRDQFAQVEMQTGAQLKLDPFDLLTQQAAQIKPGSEGVIFLPYMMGERSPLWHTNARGVFFGLSLATPRAAMIRAILEGVAFGMYHNVEVARKAGVKITEVRSVGGGARSALWNQIKADVLGVPVLLPETSVGAPFGDAVLVGMGLGLYPDVSQSLREMVRLKTRYEPNPDNHTRYQELYPLFRRIYEHLREDFDAAAAIGV